MSGRKTAEIRLRAQSELPSAPAPSEHCWEQLPAAELVRPSVQEPELEEAWLAQQPHHAARSSFLQSPFWCSAPRHPQRSGPSPSRKYSVFPTRLGHSSQTVRLGSATTAPIMATTTGHPGKRITT